MNRIIIIMLLMINTQLYAQEEYVRLPVSKEQHPTFIIDQKIVGNENILKIFGISEREQQKAFNNISILKDHPIRGLDDYYNLSEHGVVFVELKRTAPKVASKTQAELNSFFDLDESSDIYVDGYLVEGKDYKISLIGISNIELVYPNDENKLPSKVINIWTLPLDKRYRSK